MRWSIRSIILSRVGLDDFYRGDVGREIAADLERIGSPVTRDDLRHYQANIADPLSVKLNVGTLYNTPPPTQGLASLIILALYERLRVADAESFEFAHGLVECTKRAFRVRDRIVTDPLRVPQPPADFLDPKFLDIEVQKIDRRKAAKWPAPSGEGDTIWMGAADSSGLAVSYIQSLYWEFGSGCVLPKTGVLMQNRGSSFSLDRKALNHLAPGRLPFHTLNPALAVLKDGRVIAYGAMGGDGQPQSQAMIFARHVLHGQPLDKAIDAPRWLLGRTWGSDVTNLRMESRFDGHLIDRLMSAGHDVDVLSEPYSDTMGHAGAVVIHPNGTLEGAHDPRADGGAAGLLEAVKLRRIVDQDAMPRPLVRRPVGQQIEQHGVVGLVLLGRMRPVAAPHHPLRRKLDIRPRHIARRGVVRRARRRNRRPTASSRSARCRTSGAAPRTPDGSGPPAAPAARDDRTRWCPAAAAACRPPPPPGRRGGESAHASRAPARVWPAARSSPWWWSRCSDRTG